MYTRTHDADPKGPSPLESNSTQAHDDHAEFTLSMIAHEIRAPIGAVHALINLLDARWHSQLPFGAMPLWNSLHSETARLHGLVEGLLELLSVKHAPVRRDRVDLDELVKGIVRTIGPEYPLTPIVIERLGWVHGDERLLGSLWRNLISNALKYSQRTPGPQVQILSRACLRENQREFAVVDNGIGISAALRESVFKPFHRAAHARTFEGHGLGLAMVRSIAKAHGGNAWVADDSPHTKICFSLRDESRVPLGEW